MLRLEKKHHMCSCVYDYEGTLQQFNNPFHTHAENNINSLKILSLKIPLKLNTNTEARLKRHEVYTPRQN